MQTLFRVLILLSVAWFAKFYFRIATFLFLPFPQITYYGSLIFALGAGWLVWKKLNAREGSTITNVVLGAFVFGGTGIAVGVYGVLLVDPGNEQAVLGIFLGPPGFILGAILGLIVGKRKNKAWDLLLWICAIASVAVVEISGMHVTSHHSQNSSHINDATDLEKRDSSLEYLHVRPLSDDDLIKLKRFKNLWGLNFESGRLFEAKITDLGLKILETNFPNLKSLNLNFCGKITDEGMRYVAAMTRLRYIGLAACPQITDAGLSNLALSRSIDDIDLRGCSGITDEGLSYLEKMPKLKRVRLGGCTSITQHGIEELRKSLPSISIDKYDERWEREMEDLMHSDNANALPRQDMGKTSNEINYVPLSIELDENTHSQTTEERNSLGSTNEYEGVWVNRDKNNLGIPKLEITKEGNQWRIQAWGKCHPSNCDLGRVELIWLAPSVASRDYTHAFAEWKSRFMTKYMLIQIERHRLQLQTVNIWHEATDAPYRFDYAQGRSDYTSLYLFQRQQSK